MVAEGKTPFIAYVYGGMAVVGICVISALPFSTKGEVQDLSNRVTKNEQRTDALADKENDTANKLAQVGQIVIDLQAGQITLAKQIADNQSAIINTQIHVAGLEADEKADDSESIARSRRHQ